MNSEDHYFYRAGLNDPEMTDSEQDEVDHVEEVMAKWREFDKENRLIQAERARAYTRILWAVLVVLVGVIVWEMRNR